MTRSKDATLPSRTFSLEQLKLETLNHYAIEKMLMEAAGGTDSNEFSMPDAYRVMDGNIVVNKALFVSLRLYLHLEPSKFDSL